MGIGVQARQGQPGTDHTQCVKNRRATKTKRKKEKKEQINEGKKRTLRNCMK